MKFLVADLVEIDTDVWGIITKDESEIYPEVSFTSRDEDRSCGPYYQVRASISNLTSGIEALRVIHPEALCIIR